MKIDGGSLTIKDLVDVARGSVKVEIAASAVPKIKKAAQLVQKIVDEKKVVYGVSTGFGHFHDKYIPPEKVRQLQVNLLRSHAVGVGDPFPEDIVRAIILLRANSLANGCSGIRVETINKLLELLNKRVYPAVPSQGSVGASGDLAPLAHLALVLIGEGEAFIDGKKVPGRIALEKAGIEPVELFAKEGLSLINGTQVMTAIGALSVHDAMNLMKNSDMISAMSVEALKAHHHPFHEKINNLRPHKGLLDCASNLRKMLAGRKYKSSRVQDAYSLRGIPQVHGASRDAIEYVKKVIEIEINSVTDNPVLFHETEEFTSCGLFHGQPIALALDFLGIALSEIANISERRVERLLNKKLNESLPPFLTPDPGLNSGFMIAQYTAASLVSENKVLAHPASVDSIPTSAGQEDHVSMGTTAARNAWQIKKNAGYVLAIELLCAAQALEFIDHVAGVGVKAAHSEFRKHVPKLEQDRLMHPDIEKAKELIVTSRILESTEKEIGELI